MKDVTNFYATYSKVMGFGILKDDVGQYIDGVINWDIRFCWTNVNILKNILIEQIEPQTKGFNESNVPISIRD